MKVLKKYKVISLIMALTFLLSCLAVSVSAMTESEAKAQKANAAKQKAAAQYQVDMTQNTLDGISGEIDKAQVRINSINNEIDVLNGEIAETNEALARCETELKNAKDELDRQIKLYGKRMSANYMMLEPEVLIDILFSISGFEDFIEKADQIISVIQADKKMHAALEEKIQNVVKQKTAIEDNKKKIEEAKTEQETLLAEQKSIKGQLSEMFAQNQSVMESYKQQVAAQEAAEQAADQELARIAAERAREQGYSGPSSSGYIWPTTSTVITSGYGYRGAIAGLVGIDTFHNGVDIGAGYGQPIYAVASGQVTYAQYQYEGGNVIMINHGNGYTTLYAHMSSFNVGYGQTVSQGQVIGYVGASGAWVTGPHLHISFINSAGGYENPFNFLPY